MTHFPAIFKALFSRRFKRVIVTWLLALILLVGILVFTWFFQHDSFPQTRRAFFGGLVVVAIVVGGIGDIALLAEFALDDQKIWTRPVWRALPTRSWYLVFGSLLADLGAFLLFGSESWRLCLVLAYLAIVETSSLDRRLLYGVTS